METEFSGPKTDVREGFLRLGCDAVCLAVLYPRRGRWGRVLNDKERRHLRRSLGVVRVVYNLYFYFIHDLIALVPLTMPFSPLRMSYWAGLGIEPWFPQWLAVDSTDGWVFRRQSA